MFVGVVYVDGVVEGAGEGILVGGTGVVGDLEFGGGGGGGGVVVEVDVAAAVEAVVGGFGGGVGEEIVDVCEAAAGQIWALFSRAGGRERHTE